MRLSDAQFLTGISVNGYFVAAINSSHGRLFWNFTYIDEAVPGERAERLAEDWAPCCRRSTPPTIRPRGQ